VVLANKSRKKLGTLTNFARADRPALEPEPDRSTVYFGAQQASIHEKPE
jgi:hypothetical protein